MSDFGAYKTADRMRRVMDRIATAVVNRERPSERIGLVHHTDPGLQASWIRFPGETDDNLVKVRMAMNMIPTKTIQINGETNADIVRVFGAPGDFYIVDYVRGVPYNAYSENSIITGMIFQWPLGVAPIGYLSCQGQTFSATTYPRLAALVGDTHGTHSGDNYFLPDYRARSPIGIGGAATGFGYGNVYSIGQKWGHEHPATHSHGVNDPGHGHAGLNGHTSPYPGGGSNAVHFGADPPTHYGYFGIVANTTGISIQNNSGSNTGYGNVHPVLGSNFIIKT